MASSAPRGLRSDHVVTVGIALFSMLFGAGNLIIPPLLALQAGSATPLAMLGFLIAAIGLPVMALSPWRLPERRASWPAVCILSLANSSLRRCI